MGGAVEKMMTGGGLPLALLKFRESSSFCFGSFMEAHDFSRDRVLEGVIFNEN